MANGNILTQKNKFGGTEGKMIRFVDCGGYTSFITISSKNYPNHGWDYEKVYFKDSWGWPSSTHSLDHITYYPLAYSLYDCNKKWNGQEFYSFQGSNYDTGHGYEANLVWKDEDDLLDCSYINYHNDATEKYRLITNNEFSYCNSQGLSLTYFSTSSNISSNVGDFYSNTPVSFAPIISARFWTPNNMNVSIGNFNSNGATGNAKFYLSGLGTILVFMNIYGSSKGGWVNRFPDGGNSFSKPLCIPICDFAYKFIADPNGGPASASHSSHWMDEKDEHYFNIQSTLKYGLNNMATAIVMLVPGGPVVCSGCKLKISCLTNRGTDYESTKNVDFVACKIRYNKMFFDEGSGYTDVVGYAAYVQLKNKIDSYASVGTLPSPTLVTGSLHISWTKSATNHITFYNSGGWSA